MQNKAYALASAYDPIVLKNFGIEYKGINNYQMFKLFAVAKHGSTHEFMKDVVNFGNSPVNWIGINKQNGDIFYS